MYKLKDFQQIDGHVIESVEKMSEKEARIVTNLNCYRLIVEDDGSGTGNDSYAFIAEIIYGPVVKPLYGRKKISEKQDSDCAQIDIVDAIGNQLEITIKHEHNGYYGFTYELLSEFEIEQEKIKRKKRTCGIQKDV